MDRASSQVSDAPLLPLADRAQRRSAPDGFRAIRAGRLSLLIDRRAALAALILALLLGAVAGLSLGSGTVRLTPAAALSALFGQGEPRAVFVVRELRLGRVLAGALAGAALGMAGCLLQTVSRNRLANPDTLGIDNAATAFAVASVVGVGTSLAPSAMALTGAITMLALTFALSGGGGARGYRFLITGLGLGAVCGAATDLLLARAPIDAANSAYPWTVGSLNGRSGPAVAALAWGLAAAGPLALILARQLNLSRLPSGVAASLGQRVRAVRNATIGLAGLLTGLAVAVAGPLGMVGLAAPELARRLAGPRGVPVLGAGLAGAALTLLADLLGRTLFAPVEIPVGIVAALVGGPYVLWLLLSTPRGKYL